MPSKNEVRVILTKLGAMYPRFELKEETIDAYFSMLEDVPLGELRAAAAVCATVSAFFPSLYELRSAVADLRIKAQNIPTANEAFIAVSLAKPGCIWLHDIVRDVAYQMGWQHGIFPTDNVVSDRSQFIKAYDAAVSNLVWSETVIPAVLNHIESQRPIPPALPAGYSHLPTPPPEPEYLSMRDALGAETVADVAARLKAKASGVKP